MSKLSDDRPRVCARCGAEAVLRRVARDNTSEWLCPEHGYAGSWVTSDDRERRLREYQARGMRGDAIIAGAMSMIRRCRDWETSTFDRPTAVGLSRSEGVWWTASLGLDDPPMSIWAGSASDSVVGALLHDLARPGSATRIVAVDADDAHALLVLVNALGDDGRSMLDDGRIITVDMTEVGELCRCSPTEIVRRVLASSPSAGGNARSRLFREEVCERCLTAAYTGAEALAGRTRVTIQGPLRRHAPLEVGHNGM